jgi:tRNA-Thr(GGU) m(6)t(6)A37 methyltransferase TsaA
MTMDTITYTPIGTIHSPFPDIAGMPIQPAGAKGVRGHIELLPRYSEGMSDLDGFSHLILLYHFHKAGRAQLTVTPFLDKTPRGVFATRSPNHPNSIGLSVVTLLKVEGTRLSIEDVDILDGTPLIDIKPYVPRFDHRKDARTGWLEKAGKKVAAKRADDRFRD